MTKKDETTKYSNRIILKQRAIGFFFKRITLESEKVTRALLSNF
jgi:hypothetical protein